jgi:hypothetical protein
VSFLQAKWHLKFGIHQIDLQVGCLALRVQLLQELLSLAGGEELSASENQWLYNVLTNIYKGCIRIFITNI